MLILPVEYICFIYDHYKKSKPNDSNVFIFLICIIILSYHY